LAQSIIRGGGGDDGVVRGVPGAGAPSLALTIAQARLLIVVSIAACGDKEVRVEPEDRRCFLCYSKCSNHGGHAGGGTR
jgi:hypothetical protein